MTFFHSILCGPPWVLLSLLSMAMPTSGMYFMYLNLLLILCRSLFHILSLALFVISSLLYRLQPLSKFWPTPILKPPLNCYIWWIHTLGFTLWACVILYICLACSLHSSLCMLMSTSFLWPCSGYDQSLCFVCPCCVHYEIICHTHTWSHIHYHERLISINEW